VPKNLAFELLDTAKPVLGFGNTGASGFKPHSDKTQVAIEEWKIWESENKISWCKYLKIGHKNWNKKKLKKSELSTTTTTQNFDDPFEFCELGWRKFMALKENEEKGAFGIWWVMAFGTWKWDSLNIVFGDEGVCEVVCGGAISDFNVWK